MMPSRLRTVTRTKAPTATPKEEGRAEAAPRWTIALLQRLRNRRPGRRHFFILLITHVFFEGYIGRFRHVIGNFPLLLLFGHPRGTSAKLSPFYVEGPYAARTRASRRRRRW